LAIVGQINVESRRYSGWRDPRYPIAYWQGALAVTGNASGGLLGVDLVFQQANGPARLNSQMYSVERFSIKTSEQVSRTVRVAAINMGGPSNLGFSHSYSIELVTESNFVQANVAANQFGMLPLFLGSQRGAGVTASLSLVGANTDTVVYTFEAEGYRWDARSVLADGGPQRPPTGPYGQ